MEFGGASGTGPLEVVVAQLRDSRGPSAGVAVPEERLTRSRCSRGAAGWEGLVIARAEGNQWRRAVDASGPAQGQPWELRGGMRGRLPGLGLVVPTPRQPGRSKSFARAKHKHARETAAPLSALAAAVGLGGCPAPFAALPLWGVPGGPGAARRRRRDLGARALAQPAAFLRDPLQSALRKCAGIVSLWPLPVCPGGGRRVGAEREKNPQPPPLPQLCDPCKSA